jgi:hypothetical protein
LGRRWRWRRLLLALFRNLRRIYSIIRSTASLFLRLSTSIICILIMAIILLSILAYGGGSLGLVLVLEMIAHSSR